MLLCGFVNDDEQGTMAWRDDCRALANRWEVEMISVEVLVEWQRKVDAEEGVQWGVCKCGRQRSLYQ